MANVHINNKVTAFSASLQKSILSSLVLNAEVISVKLVFI
jgi:hypothetical protein